MRDPHVETLHYVVFAEAGTEYIEPRPLLFSHPLGDFAITSERLTFSPSEHFAVESESRAAVEPFLRAWEAESDLLVNPGTIRFRFERAAIIDRDPPPPGAHVMLVGVAAVCTVTATMTAVVGRRTYPEPPLRFALTSQVEMVFRRWSAYRAGAEPLQSMVYFVLTVMEDQAGGRRHAARVFDIDEDILRTLGDLSSTRGNAANARKMPRGGLRDLTGAETQWMETVIRRVVRRMGEHASGTGLQRITISDFPLLLAATKAAT